MRSIFVHSVCFAACASIVFGGDPSPPAGCVPVVPATGETCPGLGRAQGVTVVGSRVYLFGDADTGVLREYDLGTGATPALTATGRVMRLTRYGTNLLNHPTGFAMHDGMPCFLGNTVTATRQGKIYRLDFNRALRDGTLDHGVLNETLDDLAVQGARPEYVRVDGRFLVATSDYGPGPNFVRFYDPARLATASRTSDPGVLVKTIPCGPWVQSLAWIDDLHTLVIVQNIIEGRRWRLTLVSDLDAPDYRTGPGVQVIDVTGHNDELEGYARVSDAVGIYITSSRENNVTFARLPAR